MEFSNYQGTDNNFSIKVRSKEIEHILDAFSGRLIKKLIKQGVLSSDKHFKSTINLTFNIEVADE